jgi:hypothetical protein
MSITPSRWIAFDLSQCSRMIGKSDSHARFGPSSAGVRAIFEGACLHGFVPAHTDHASTEVIGLGGAID